jgi:hypothetical protein
MKKNSVGIPTHKLANIQPILETVDVLSSSWIRLAPNIIEEPMTALSRSSRVTTSLEEYNIKNSGATFCQVIRMNDDLNLILSFISRNQFCMGKPPIFMISGKAIALTNVTSNSTSEEKSIRADALD